MTDSEIRTILAERLAMVEARIEAACQRAARPRTDVTLVAVTKSVAARVAGLLPEVGLFDFGESRPQELTRKMKLLPNPGIRWHMIGHLQRNKVAEAMKSSSLIHSVDSDRLYAEIVKESAKRTEPIAMLFQVNGSREEAKSGFDYAELEAILKDLKPAPNLESVGFMTMAANEASEDDLHATFRELRLFRERFPIGKALSMGMSNDFEIAIEEGATLIRLGSVLFEGLPGPETEK